MWSYDNPEFSFKACAFNFIGMSTHKGGDRLSLAPIKLQRVTVSCLAGDRRRLSRGVTDRGSQLGYIGSGNSSTAS